ncbi:hypothetical protein GQ53DRAFT_718552 [Thozetella sp. PMI_491]|nr:hypothetical protein GQ53DRAFT_718552 [Thozetella sp. PMI_491]
MKALRAVVVASGLGAAVAEEIHLVNCDGAPWRFSSIAYYAGSPNGNPPASDNLCNFALTGFTTWEGATLKRTFTTGVTVTTHIKANAQNEDLWAEVGSVSNGFKTFTCYKDDKHLLWQTGGVEGGEFCRSIYYCLPN